jgi:hypothetical protein
MRMSAGELRVIDRAPLLPFLTVALQPKTASLAHIHHHHLLLLLVIDCYVSSHNGNDCILVGDE